MNRPFAIVSVRWMSAAWKQPLAHMRRLASPLGSLAGVALLRRPMKLAPVLARPHPVVRHHPNRLHP